MRDADVKNAIERMSNNLKETNMNIDQLIEDVVTQLDKDPMDQMVDTETIIREFVKAMVLAEREACARMLEAASKTGEIISCMGAAKAIRARG